MPHSIQCRPVSTVVLGASSLALAICFFIPRQALATHPYKTATCDPANPSHIPPSEAMRRASLNRMSEDFPCWVYIAAVQNDKRGEYEWAHILNQNKLWDEAFPFAEKSAAQGDSEAAWILSEYYRTGKGAPMDLAKAQHWRAIAFQDPKVRAEAGNQSTVPAATATCDPKDPAKYSASEYRAELQKAIDSKNQSEGNCWVYVGAVRGDPYSEVQYGQMLLFGRGFQMNTNEAFVWCKKSADQGDLSAALVVAYMYSQGLGVSTDMTRANYWAEKASKNPAIAKSLQAAKQSLAQKQTDAQIENNAIASFFDDYIGAPMRRGEVGKAMSNLDKLAAIPPALPCTEGERSDPRINCTSRRAAYDAWEKQQEANPLQK